MMRAKVMTFLTGVLVFTIILLTGYQAAEAASPAGEVKTVAPLYGNEIPIPSFDTALAKNWMQLFYDPLVGCTPEGKFSPDLGLANKWEMSPNGSTWTFYLRKGVKFHDGVELTAKDVKFSIEQVMLPGATSINAGLIRRSVKSVDAKDPYTVVVHCKQPIIFLLNLFSNMEGTDGMVLPKDYYERVGRDQFQKRPIGTGPYKWHSQILGSFIKLEATDKHWRDGVPKYKYMTYLIIPEESTRIAMLKTGEADICRISRGAMNEALSAGLNVLNKESDCVVTLVPHMQWASRVFSDIRFRKALNLAIDKEAIITHLLAGVAKPIASYPGSNIFAVGGDPTLKPYPYDPQEAKRLIKEGGWEGYEFTMMSYDRAGFSEGPQAIEAIAGYWEKVGLKPKIRISEYAVFRNAWDERKTQNTIHCSDSSLNPEIFSVIQKMAERFYFKEKRSCVNIPELNERFERIEKSMDIAEISKLITEIYRYAYDHYLLISLCEISDIVATTQRIPKWDLGRRRQEMNYSDLIRQR